MIRAYSEVDTDDLVDIWYRASLVGHPFLTEDFLNYERGEIVDTWLPMAETTVYEADGKVVGFISLVGNEVGGIFVDPECHGQGVGRALMNHARDSRPFLELDVFEENDLARRFYDAYGFRVLDRHVNEKAGQQLLRLRLD